MAMLEHLVRLKRRVYFQLLFEVVQIYKQFSTAAVIVDKSVLSENRLNFVFVFEKFSDKRLFLMGL